MFGEAVTQFGDKVTDMACLSDDLDARTFSQPTGQSFEQRLRARLDDIRKVKSKSVAES